jgi:site-specific DNA recombinase
MLCNGMRDTTMNLTRCPTRRTGEPSAQALLYARVSSKEQEQGYSIPAQQELLRVYGAQLDMVIEHEFLDAETAKTTGRPGFTAMVSYLKQHPGCRALLVEKTDRLYRNFKDYLTIDELDLEIHLVKENVILTKDARSSEKFMHGIKVLMAKNYIDNLREEVQKGLRTNAAQGLYPSFAPLGYNNMIAPDGKRIIAPDLVLGPMIRSLFTWFSSGEYSLKALAKKAYEEGFRFRKSRNKVPVTTLHKILRKRIYTGEFDYGGTRYRGVHDPLVTGAVWERCQEILDGRHEKKHRKVKHDFAFSGIVRCGHCGCSLVGEMKKGRYVYYHCTGYRGKCPEPYTREETLVDRFAGRLRDLVIPPEIIMWLQDELVTKDMKEQAEREQTMRRYEAERDRIQARLDILYEDRLDGRIDASTYDKKAGEMREGQRRFLTKMTQCQSATPAPATEALDLMSLTSKAAALFTNQTSAEKRRLLRLILEQATWRAGELRMCFREPFECLRLSNSASATSDGHFAADEHVSGIWRRKRDSNPRASYPANGFQDRRLQPLGHSSNFKTT